MNNFVKIFGAKLKEHRKKQGFSQEAVAEKAGIHRTYVSAIENGKTDLSLSIAEKVANALGKKLSDVIAEVEESSNQKT